MNKTLIALSLAATALAGTANAQRPRSDANGDGVITRAEAAAQADARFAAMDADRDGTVTPEERRAMAQRMRAERDARVVTKDQFEQRAEQRFDRLDADDDGKLTGAERRASGHGPHRAMARAEAARPDMERPVPQPETAAEFRTRALARFDRTDTNHDGRIDPAERAAGHRRMGPPPAGEPRPPVAG